MPQLEKNVEILMDFLVEETPLRMLPRSDVIFVFGHYEPTLARHAAFLWQNNLASRVLVSGKGGRRIPSPFATEAEFYASILVSAGIPLEMILLEKEATNSLENVRFGIQRAQEVGVEVSSAILCAMPPLLRRSCATFRKQFPNIIVHGSAFPIPSGWFTTRRVQRLVGEIDRLVEYAIKGDTVPVEIPPEVLRAAETIRQSSGD